jgi:uncharacterized protein YdhG (YjbR/CyaY superfamily)
MPASRKPAKKSAATTATKASKKVAKKVAVSTEPVFTDEERAAIKEYAAEARAAKRGGARARAADGASEVLAKIAAMPAQDRTTAERVHAVVTSAAPTLTPRLWYGMPAYSKDGKVLVFLQPAHKFKTRYSTLGFSDEARLDEGTMWPSSFAVTKLTAADERRIAALVKKAMG